MIHNTISNGPTGVCLTFLFKGPSQKFSKNTSTSPSVESLMQSNKCNKDSTGSTNRRNRSLNRKQAVSSRPLPAMNKNINDEQRPGTMFTNQSKIPLPRFPKLSRQRLSRSDLGSSVNRIMAIQFPSAVSTTASQHTASTKPPTIIRPPSSTMVSKKRSYSQRSRNISNVQHDLLNAKRRR